MLSSLPFFGLLLYPPNLYLLMLVGAVVFALAQRRRTALILTLSGLLWVLVWSLPETSLYLGGKLETRYHYQLSETLPKADVIVVLGGNIQGNRANWFEPYNRATATDRVDRAAELYFAGRAPKIILSGGALEGRVSDARAMARTLRQKGVPESAVILENEARNTYENALLTQSLLASMGLKTVLVVTSALHMPRAMAAFNGLGVRATPAGLAPQIVAPDDYTLDMWTPHMRSLEASRSIIKEYLGLFGYWLRGWI